MKSKTNGTVYFATISSNKQSKTLSKSFANLKERLQNDLSQNQSYLNLILGGLLIGLVIAIFAFNYFTKDSRLGPAQQTENTTQAATEGQTDKYTVKEGDTLYLIAQQFYGDGFLFSKLAEANKITDVDKIEVGQVLEIPKKETVQNPNTPSLNADIMRTQKVEGGTGGAMDQTEWGEKITSDTYTVVAGDWLSKIAGRTYGDIYAWAKIVQANNISDPNLIEPGTVLKIPR